MVILVTEGKIDKYIWKTAMAKETTSKTSNGKIRPVRHKADQANMSKARSQNTSKPLADTSSYSVQAPMLTHEQIAERVKKIWQARGCVPGFDEQNWHEAETQLKTELEVH